MSKLCIQLYFMDSYLSIRTFYSYSMCCVNFSVLLKNTFYKYHHFTFVHQITIYIDCNYSYNTVYVIKPIA